MSPAQRRSLGLSIAQTRSLRVVWRTSAMRYTHHDHALPEIARELDVDLIVEGSVIRAGDRVRITARLIDAPSDEHLWSGSYDAARVMSSRRSRAQTYLRGIQTTNGDGQVTFTTVYPGWYQGRATHIHVEGVRNGVSSKVTQIAFPESVNAAVYATGVYASRGSNPTANARDGIFADSLDSEMASVSGDATNGFAATFRVGIAA